MIIIPIERKGQPRRLIVIIEVDNMLRMRGSDPITLELNRYLKTGGVDELLIAYEPDSTKLMEFVENKDLDGLTKWIQRGWKFIDGVDGVKKEVLM